MACSFSRPIRAAVFLTSTMVMAGAIRGSASPLTITDVKADVTVGGSYHTTVVKQGDTPANDHNSNSTKVIVRYTIAVKTNPDTNKKEFDLAKSTATFENEGFVTTEIPITSVNGNPETGAIDSFMVKSDKAWDPNRADQSNGLTGEVDVKNKKANLTASYTSGTATPTITSHTFATDDKKPAAPKKDAKNGKPFAVESTIPSTESLDYDAASRTLSIHGDTIVGTPDADPILGAALGFSDFLFTGFTTDGQLAIFWPDGDASFTMTKGGELFERSVLPVLFYDPTDDSFYAALTRPTLAGMSPGSPFYNPDLSTASSPFFNDVDSVLNPFSADFDPFAVLFLTIDPDVDFGALTDQFTQSGHAGARDLHFVADPVPEPATWLLVVTGGALASRRRKPRVA